MKEKQDTQKEIDKTSLLKELEEIGYSPERDIDVTNIYIEDGKIQITAKGGPELQNIIYYTYDLHNQKYPIVVDKPIDSSLLPLEEKVAVIAKFMLDNFKTLFGTDIYNKERKNRIDAYQGTWKRVIYTTSIAYHMLPHVQTLASMEEIEGIRGIKMVESIWKNGRKKNLWNNVKSLTMKIIQLILAEKDEYEYTKYGLATKFDNFFPRQGDNALWYLMRGRKGIYNENLMQTLIDEYRRIASNVQPIDIVWHNLTDKLVLEPIMVPSDIFFEFLRSPIKPTEKFIHNFKEISPTFKDINALFSIISKNTKLLPEYVIHDHLLDLDQRFLEWKHALKFYKTGDNTGVVELKEGEEWVGVYYNLIRGSLMEHIVIHSCELGALNHLFPNSIVNCVTVGLLVENKGVKNSKGVAPDLLLVVESETKNSSEIIPVEIKCLKRTKIDNADYRRGLSLARRQLQSVATIINITRGIILFIYVDEPLTDQSSHVELYATVIPLK